MGYFGDKYPGKRKKHKDSDSSKKSKKRGKGKGHGKKDTRHSGKHSKWY